jgi:hypothetical protein
MPISREATAEHATLESISMIEVSIGSDRSADPGYLRPGYSQKELAANGQQPTHTRQIGHSRQRSQSRPAAKPLATNHTRVSRPLRVLARR